VTLRNPTTRQLDTIKAIVLIKKVEKIQDLDYYLANDVRTTKILDRIPEKGFRLQGFTRFQKLKKL
jgi:hypothetical protein